MVRVHKRPHLLQRGAQGQHSVLDLKASLPIRHSMSDIYSAGVPSSTAARP